MFLTTVKSRINGRIGRNSNRIFILYIDRSFIEFGFVRHFRDDRGHAILEIRVLRDRNLVEQNGPLRPELNRLGFGRFS